jgi:O-antigen ligase
MLRFASLYVSPDPKIDAVNSSNPLDSISSLLQYGIYGLTFLLLLARSQSSVQTALREKTIWLLAIFAFLSFLWSDFPDQSQRKGITLLQTSYFGWYVASRFTIKQQLALLAWALGIISIISLLFTLAFPGAAVEAGANAGSWRGPFTQKNLLARIMVLGALVFLLLALDTPKKRFVLWSGFSLCLLLVLLTNSKTGLLLLFMLVMLVPLYKALRWKDTKIIPLLVIGVLITGTIATLVIGNWEATLLSLGRDPTLSGRTNLWEAAIEKIMQRPWLGYGYQGFWLEDGEAFDIWKAEGYKPPHAHNGFINMTLDFGLVGLFLFLLTLTVNYARAINWLCSGNRVIDLWPICYITFFFMYNHSENTIVEHNSIFWALLVTVALSMRRIYRITSKPGEAQNQNFS